MRVVVLGLRAMPGVAGGVESHCERLYPLLADAGVDVEVIVRGAYVDPSSAAQWRGLRLRRVWSLRWTGVETLVHTFLGVLVAARTRPDILHLHSVGPALFTPLARALGLRVVVTCHAPDYEQAKWGRFARWLLRTGERLGTRHANAVIAVSRHGARSIERTWGRAPVMIPNGVSLADAAGGTEQSSTVHRELGVEPGRYVLHVGRAIPDKRQDDLIAAFARAGLSGWKLVLVGDLSGDDPYSTRVRALAAANPDVVLAGFRRGGELRALFAEAGCFAFPSAVEGFSIALAEAIASGCPIVASDIPANHEIELPAECYVPIGDLDALADAIGRVAGGAICPSVRAGLRERIHGEYDWSAVARNTLRVYEQVVVDREPTALGLQVGDTLPRKPTAG